MYRFNYPDWSTVHHKHWKPLLDKHLDLDHPIIMAEIGCFEGRSTVWFADYLEHHPDSRLFCIDNWQGGEEVERVNLQYDMKKVEENFYSNLHQHPQEFKMITHKTSSEHGLSCLMFDYYRNVDFIYLDGSHTQKDTLVDLTMAMSLLKRGGMIIVDDYNNSMATNNKLLRPKDAVDFVVKTFDNEIEFFTTPEQQAVIIRK